MDANPFLMDLLGYSLAELIGKELWEIGLFTDKQESKAAMQRLLHGLLESEALQNGARKIKVSDLLTLAPADRPAMARRLH